MRAWSHSPPVRSSPHHLEPELSTEDVPAHTFDREEKLSPGEVVELQIEMFSVGLHFSAGQQVRLVISAHHPHGPLMANLPRYIGDNAGRHVVHTGGEHASFLRVPVRQG